MSNNKHSRRDFLVGAAKLTTLGISGAALLSGMSKVGASTSAVGLIPYGAAARSDALLSDLSYRDAIVANCQMIVPESELKWQDLRPARDQYQFDKADMMVDFARQNRLEIRGHTLAWYGAMPAWTETISTHAEAERELTDHIETVVSRYRGAIPCWDVINEPLADWPENEVSFRPSIWARRLGADYLAIALRTAAKADPEARLVLNEYDVEFTGPASLPGARRW
jgi:endo-1,4-beta-xylanase